MRGKFFRAATPAPAQGQVPSGGEGLWFGTTGFVFQNHVRARVCAVARGLFGAADAPDTALCRALCQLSAGARRVSWWAEWGKARAHADPQLLCPLDAKDLEQLSRNKITHIVSIHETPQPLLQVQSCARRHHVRLCSCVHAAASSFPLRDTSSAVPGQWSHGSWAALPPAWETGRLMV